MIELDAKGNTLYVVVSEKLTGEDYKQFVPRVEELLKEHKKLRLYFEMQNFKGWDVAALWADVKLDMKHANDFEKVAMVGEKTWQDWIAQLMKPFTKAEIKYFDIAG